MRCLTVLQAATLPCLLLRGPFRSRLQPNITWQLTSGSQTSPAAALRWISSDKENRAHSESLGPDRCVCRDTLRCFSSACPNGAFYRHRKQEPCPSHRSFSGRMSQEDSSRKLGRVTLCETAHDTVGLWNDAACR